jgi:16S rRNA (adenine1518-N6/adenine1519-N6)-dimethyltransferase
MIIRAKKSLGQNFLKSESALNEIIIAGKVAENDVIFEIGPGQGALTEKILRTGAETIVIEKDRELIPILQTRFAKNIEIGQLKIIDGDILDFDEQILEKPYKLIANIPYYITGAIIRKFLSSKNQPENAVLLVQKEVAERIVSKPEKNGTDKHPKNKESLLSISVKVYCEPKFIKTVPAGSFAPAPKVDSAIILLENISKKHFLEISETKKLPVGRIEDYFFEMLHYGFAHKRKVLIKNLKPFLEKKQIKKIEAVKILEQINKTEKTRAEELSISDWLHLIKNFLK